MPPGRALSERVLRVKRTDVEGEYVLVNVSAAGSAPLDVKLVASEAEHVYPLTIQDSAVNSFQASNYHGDLDEWRTILKYALLQQPPDKSSPATLDGLEIVAAINGRTLTLTLRKNISRIIQRLGSIKIQQDDEGEEVSPFDWCFTAVAQTDDLRDQLGTLQTSVSSANEQVSRLNKQLDDLVRAKKEHEAELLQKFAALLNTKKLKIRDQQRLLAGAQLPQESAQAVRDTRDGDFGVGRRAITSRGGKRKANGSADSSPDDLLADAETATEDEDELARLEGTPQQSDQEAEESDGSGFEATLPPSRPNRHGAGGGQETTSRVDAKAHDGQAMEVKEPGPPPPRRELPFTRKAGVAASVEKPKKEGPSESGLQQQDEDEDEETDEEL
ncbi:hypothetical protein B0A50_05411 [Salinomyces thailandicus]|uniref:XRCC4 coiled-coil domain-containing protein n=1 Tax=Salinomyces thailandicus TaxID=706561 RepID=A0A4U0TTK5_9PEZI|nr:hypothetical protein B0A50_05411 [Salinomyces thailandica]